MNLWRCPSARFFMKEICHLVREGGKFVCVVLPTIHIDSFVDAFMMYSQKYLVDVHHVHIDSVGDIESTFLKSAFEEENLRLENVMDANAVSMYLLLDFRSDLQDPTKKCRQFFLHLNELAKIRKDESGTLLWRMIAVLPAHIAWPSADVCLELKHWWGQLHPSDTEYAIERCSYEIYHGKINEWEYLWLYSLCQGLSTIDPMISDAVFKNLPTTLEEIKNILAEHPLMHIDKEAKQLVIYFDQHASRQLSHEAPPDGDVRKLWSIGALDIRENGQTALHPAAVYAANRGNSVEKLVVQGQIKVFFPIVQEVHTFICSQLKKSCGDKWNKKSDAYYNINDEIGAIPRYMNEYLKGQHDPMLYDLATEWRNLRNSLAHGHIINCSDAVHAYKLYEKLRDRLV